MNKIPNTQDFRDLAARVIWFEPPEMALQDLTRFMAYAFRYATHEDMAALRSALSDDDLRKALAEAPPGIIDARSWSYWHSILGRFPPPPMPKRNIN